MDTSPVSAALGSIVIAPAVSFENLAMFPLVLRDDVQPAVAYYRTLDDALNRGDAEITEISEQGSVPELRLVNRGWSPVLIVDGEELVGAKQNRVVNLTILVASRSELTIPVSCVEAGRWRMRSRSFSSAPRAHFATGRARRMARVTQSMATLGTHYADQSEVWADIADKFATLRTTSPTGAMEALFQQHASFLDECVSACQRVDRQVGALFTLQNRIVGFDMFDAPDTLTALLPKLVRSVAVDALDHRDSGRPSRMAQADEGKTTFATALFLGAVGSAWCHDSPAVGLGRDLRLTGPGVTGAALVNDGRIVHLSAYSLRN
jgi:hypothetical protein